MTSETEQSTPAPLSGEAGAKSVAPAAVKPKPGPNVAKRPAKRRPASKPREPTAYDQGFRSGPRVWPD